MTTNPAHRRNGGIAIGAVAALVAGGLTAAALRDSSPPAPAAHAAPALRETTEVTGRAVLVAPGGAVSVVDLATGGSTRLFTDDRLSYSFRAGKSVVVGGGANGGANGRLYAVHPDGSYDGLPPALVAKADASSGVWTFVPAGPKARHYGLDGRPVGPPVRLPDGTDLTGAYDGGLVLNTGESYNVRLWDPATRTDRARRELVRALDVVAGRIAWVPDLCDRDCPVSWYDLPSALRDEGGRIELGGVVRQGELSEDGSWLALRVDGAPDPLVVCELAAGTCARPRGATGELRLAWAADDRTLLVGDAQGDRLRAWRPGWDELQAIPGRHPAQALAALGAA